MLGNEDLLKLALLAVTLTFSAFFSASEAAFLSVGRVRMLHLANTGRPGATRVLEMVENPGRMLSTVLLGNNLANTAAAALGTAVAISFVDDINSAVLASTIVVTALLLIFCEILPKTLASTHPERAVFLALRPLELLERALLPLVWLLQGFSRLIATRFGGSDAGAVVTAQEIRSLISVGREAGAVEVTEAKMLEKVFHFGDLQAKEIMTPRPEMVWLDKDATLRDFLPVFATSSHARYALCDGDPDNLMGVLYIKDVLQGMAPEALLPELPLAPLLRPAHFVPETKRVADLFEEMRSAGHQMAIIVDEYGGTAGLVTLKQLIEEIVGRVGEEALGQEQEFEAIDEHTFQVDGSMRIDEMNEALHLDLPEGSYETVAGFLLSILGHIPRPGEQVRYDDLRLTVAEMHGVKIEKVRITQGG